MKKITVEEYIEMNKVQRKFVDLYGAARRMVNETIKWVIAHPQESAIVGAGLGAAAGIFKTMIRTHNLNKRRELKERYIYDRSLNAYLRTKRKLNNKDFERINREKQNGKRLSDILYEMNLLE